MHETSQETVAPCAGLRQAHLSESAMDWLESDLRILAFWCDQLVAANASEDLVAGVMQHRAFVADLLHRVRREGIASM